MSRPRCGFPDCTSGPLDIATIAPGDALRCVKNRWWTVTAVAPAVIAGNIHVTFDDTPPWSLEVRDWCSCKHRTAAELYAERLEREGAIQESLFDLAVSS